VTSPEEDGFHWRKHDEKKILHSVYPILYYRCGDRSCQAKKQVQQVFSDPLLFDVVYHGQHTCVEGVHSHAEIMPPLTTTESRLVTYDYEAASSVSMTRVQMSPATSESQITYEESTAGFDSMENYPLNGKLDLNLPPPAL